MVFPPLSRSQGPRWNALAGALRRCLAAHEAPCLRMEIAQRHLAAPSGTIQARTPLNARPQCPHLAQCISDSTPSARLPPPVVNGLSRANLRPRCVGVCLGQEAVSSQRAAVSSQRSAVSGQQSAYMLY